MDFLPTLSRMSFEERRRRRVFPGEEARKDSFISSLAGERAAPHRFSMFKAPAFNSSPGLSLPSRRCRAPNKMLTQRLSAGALIPRVTPTWIGAFNESSVPPSRIQSLPFVSCHRALTISHDVSLILCVETPNELCK